MNKALLIIAAVIIIGSLVLVAMMGKVNLERIQKTFVRDGMNVANVEQASDPAHDAVEHHRMTVNGAFVQVFRFTEKDKMEACYTLYRDPVRARDQLSNLAATSYVPIAAPTLVAQNGWYVLTVTSGDEALRNRIIYLFREL